jgi:hypothetical protein
MARSADDAMEKLALRWSKLAKTCKLVPLVDAQETETDTMYQCMLFELNKVPVPKSLMDKINGVDKKYKIQMHINATLFHTKRGAFFGNTWTGPRETVNDSNLTKEKGVDVKWNGNPAVLCSLKLGSKYGFIFHTKTRLPDVRAAVELVMTVTDIKGEIRGEEYGICWGVLPLATSKNASDFSRKADSEVQAQLWAGTPRLLLFLGADEYALGKQKNAKLPNAMIKFVSLIQSKAESAVMELINANELVGGQDPTLAVIPGLKNKFDAIEIGGGSLKKAASCAIVLKELTVNVSQGIDMHIKKHVQRATGKSATLLGLVMEVGVHNGRKFVASPKEYALVPGGNKGEYVCSKACTLAGYAPHNMMAVIALVYATVDVSGEQGKMCLGWASVVPVEISGTGPLLVGNIKLHLKTTQPMPCVTNSIIFSDDETGKGSRLPTLSFELDKGLPWSPHHPVTPCLQIDKQPDHKQSPV